MSEPIPLRRAAEEYGQRAGEWARRLEHRLAQGKELARAAREFWREIQEPEGKQRHIWQLLALAAGAGLVIGFLSAGRRS